MLQNAFAGEAKQPATAALVRALGESHVLWQRLVDDLTRELHLDGAEWHTSSIKLGWSLRLARKKRNIVYLGPRAGFFVASFALGDKGVRAALNSELPAPVKKIIAQSKRYAEGTAVRIEVRSPEDATIVKVLAKIKIEN